MLGGIGTPNRLLLSVGLLGGLALLLIAAVKPEPMPRPWEYATIGMVYGTFLGQGVLAAGWAALGTGHLLWRVSLSLGWLGASLVALAINVFAYGPGDEEVLVIFAIVALGQWGITQVPLWFLVYGYGVRLKRLDEGVARSDRRERQFGIRQLMILTAMVAVLLGAGRLIMPWLAKLEYFRDAEPLLIISYLAIAGIFMLVPLLLAALLPRRAALASFLVVAAISAFTLVELELLNVLRGAVGGGGPEVGHFIGLNVAQAFWVLSVAAVVRFSRYQLVVPAASDSRAKVL